MPNPSLLPRLATPRLVEALADSPVVLLHGPRQCGKTTLVREVGSRLGFEYFTFDDGVSRAAAEADPVGFVADLPDRAILDEVQRVPSIFTTLKAAIDRRRTAGRFLLTGSANVLLLPEISDSLAGRIDVIRLHPLAQCEIGRRASGFIDRLFEGRFGRRRQDRLGRRLAERMVAGGYPPALERTGPRQARWYRNYVDALVQRDVRDVARIASLDALPRLLAAAAVQTAQLVNVADLASPFQLSRPTIGQYVSVLERLFLLDRLPPWHANRLSRLVKTPKLHLGDSGLACALLGLDAEGLFQDRPLLGRILESFVYQELRRHASGHAEPIEFLHFRDRDDAEVDIVLDRGAKGLVGVEVKASATIGNGDFRGLRKLAEMAGARFVGGVVLYDGEAVAPFGERLHAVPIGLLWES